MILTKTDFVNLRTLLSRVNYQGLDEAKLAVLLEAKLTASIEAPDGNSDSTGSDKPSAGQPAGN